MGKTKWFVRNYGLLLLGILFIGMMWRDYLNDPFDPTRGGTNSYGHNSDGVFSSLSVAVGLELLVAYAIVRPWSYRRSWGRALCALCLAVPWTMLSLLVTMHAGGVVALHALWMLCLSGVLGLVFLGSLLNEVFVKKEGDGVTLKDQYVGALLGLACGDAVGTTLEFAERGSFAPLADMVGGGPFELAAGRWTDDTSMALCLAESLIAQQGFEPKDQMARYANWWQRGYLSSTGVCFDIGMTVQTALLKYLATGEPYCGAVDEYSAGNGSLMRLAPVVLFAHPDLKKVLDLTAKSSCTTHGAAEAIESCQLLGCLLSAILNGVRKDHLFNGLPQVFHQAKIKALASGAFVSKNVNEIKGSGYCVESLEAALWCFLNSHDFESAVLQAANLGDDADTTAAIVGQIAGAYYGAAQIPQAWREKLFMKDEIVSMAERLYELSSGLKVNVQ
ncbi:MAG: ADP-ribosylglycohydrolase family protein [Formosimonas sp.]